jgi:hypothetical protein
MSDVRVSINAQLPNDATDEQREQAAADNGDFEAARRLSNVVEQDHAEAVIKAMQIALDSLADDLPDAVGLRANGSVGAVNFDLIPTPPKETRREARTRERDSKQEPVTTGTATTNT